jgi:parallel beta-helix repeat protein
MTKDSFVIRNYVYPAINTTPPSGNIMGSLVTSTGNTFQDNIIEYGILAIPDSKSFVIHNTVKNSSGDNLISGSDNQIRDNVINISVNDYGINLASASNDLVSGNYIYHFNNGTSSFGIYTQGNNHIIRNNYIYGSWKGINIALGGGYYNIVDGNTLMWNGLRNNVGIILEGNSQIKNNVITGYTTGIQFARQANSVFGNVVLNATNGIYLTSSSDSGITMANNSIYGNDFKNTINNEKAGNNVQENNNYIQRWSYTVSLTGRPCSSGNAFDERTIHNSTTSCTCTGGAWKCWVMS